MPIYRPTLPGNQQALQRQINRNAAAPLGPVSITPGQGHIRLNDGTNDTGRLDVNGVSVRYRGALRGLTELTESFATGIEGHTALLSTHDGRLDGHDADVTRIDAKDAAQDDSLSRKAWTSYVVQVRDDANARMSGIDSSIASHNTRINTAQSRADSAYSRASTGISNAATAQSRADSAYSLAAGRATQGQISDLSGRITDLAGRMSTIEGRLSTIISFLRSKHSDFPM